MSAAVFGFHMYHRNFCSSTSSATPGMPSTPATSMFTVLTVDLPDHAFFPLQRSFRHDDLITLDNPLGHCHDLLPAAQFFQEVLFLLSERHDLLSCAEQLREADHLLQRLIQVVRPVCHGKNVSGEQDFSYHRPCSADTPLLFIIRDEAAR